MKPSVEWTLSAGLVIGVIFVIVYVLYINPMIFLWGIVSVGILTALSGIIIVVRDIIFGR